MIGRDKDELHENPPLQSKQETEIHCSTKHKCLNNGVSIVLVLSVPIFSAVTPSCPPSLDPVP